jgi:AAA domain (dynein-related subfamily).
MNIKQAKEEIKHTVKAYLAKDASGMYQIPAICQRPILLIGPPGIGKTQIMEQIARECRIGLVAYTITHHTRQSAVGLPFIIEETYNGKAYSITEYTMSEIISSIYRKMRDSQLSEGILFIDEINCVSETLAPTMLQFLQCKTFGNQAVPQGWIIVAAGNPPEYNKSVRDFDMVTLDRVRYMELEANYAVWKEYAKAAHIHRAILSYLELRPDQFYRVEADVDGMQFVTARGWEDLSHLMKTYEALHIPVTEEVVSEFLHHKETALDAAAYFDLFHKYEDDYGIHEILAGKIRPQIYARIGKAAFDERLSVTNLICDGLSQYFIHAAQEKERTDLWYAFLKQYRSQLSDAKAPDICYSRLFKQQEETFLLEQEGNLYSRTQLQNREWLLKELRNSIPKSGQSPKEAFATAKIPFDLQQERLEQADLAACIALEHAFDFMEQAFTGGQEMVVFVTDLTIGIESSAFLSEHPCERYIRYNEQLLIGTRREQLLSELARDQEQFT